MNRSNAVVGFFGAVVIVGAVSGCGISPAPSAPSVASSVELSATAAAAASDQAKTLGSQVSAVAGAKPDGLKTVLPQDGKELTPAQALEPIAFRWTPLVPKPKEPVTYRLRVWQLMQGQSGSTAMRTNKPIVTKDVADLTEATVSGIYTGPCRPPYLCDYVWTVDVATGAGAVGPTSEPSTFSVKEIDYKAPEAVLPKDGKELTPAQAEPIAFRWTPVVPKPQQPVTYRLKVWQLMQGQSGSTAMRTNKPIVTKDVADITEASVSGIYTGPCRPPYLCDYVWVVEAATGAGAVALTSEPSTFSVKEVDYKAPEAVLPKDGKELTPAQAELIAFRWTPVVPKPQEPVTYRLRVWQLMQGQSGSTAMRTNKPIVTKDVADITEASVGGIYTGPCRPPYLCDYVWVVEAATGAGAVALTSQPSTFSIK